MSDLTDEDLELAATVGTRLQAANRRAYVDRDTLNLADRLQRAALELQRHRSALAADRERVRSVVYDVALDALRWHKGDPLDRADAIATRAAEQLATAWVGLSEDERSDLESLLEELADRREVSIGRGRFVDADILRDQHAALAKLLGASK